MADDAVGKPVYGPEDRGEPDRGAPGVFPYTRGVYPTMYTTRPWTMRQYAGFGTAEETNARFRRLLDAGQTGLSTAFDLPTQMGFDSDHQLAVGEVGRVGVAIDTVDDLAVLFHGIPLDQVSTSMTINATAAILLAMYVVVGEEHGVQRTALRGTVQNDILKEYVARGTYIYPAEPSLRLVTDLFRFVSAEDMQFNPISISGYHIFVGQRGFIRKQRPVAPAPNPACQGRQAPRWAAPFRPGRPKTPVAAGPLRD